MLQNAYFLAKIGADTAENEQHFAEFLPTDALWPRSPGAPPRLAARRARGGRGRPARSARGAGAPARTSAVILQCKLFDFAMEIAACCYVSCLILLA